jgi:hypothetical protein
MSNLNLSNEIHDIFADVLAVNHAELVPVSNTEVLLKTAAYSLNIYVDHDGVSVIYFDKISNPIKGYNVILFLLNKRRSLLSFDKYANENAIYIDRLRSDIKSVARHLTQAGQDILEGKKEWLKEYSWQLVSPSKDVSLLM